MAISIIFSAPLPLLTLVGVFSLGFQYVQDKYMLLNYHSYNPKQGIRLQKQMARLALNVLKMLPVILCLHLFVSLLTYGSEQFFPQIDTLGYVDSKWNLQSDFKLIYKFLKIMPLSILLCLCLLCLVFDFLKDTFCCESKNVKVNVENKNGVEIANYL